MLSIPLIVFGSTVIMKAIDRFPVIVYMEHRTDHFYRWRNDRFRHGRPAVLAKHFHGTPYLAMALTVGVIGFGWWHNKIKGRTAKDVLVADEHAAERLEDAID